MSATSRFAPMAMPLFLTKLTASLGESKKDVLKSIRACLPVFGGQAIENYSPDLWDALKTEVSPGVKVSMRAYLMGRPIPKLLDLLLSRL